MPKILYSQQDDASIAIRTAQHGKKEAAKQIIVNAVKEALKGKDIEYRTIYLNSGVKPRIILTTNPTYDSEKIMDIFRATPGIFEERTGDEVQELDGLLSGMDIGTPGGGSRKSNKSSKIKKYKTTKNKKNKKPTKHKKTKKTKKNKKTRR